MPLTQNSWATRTRTEESPRLVLSGVHFFSLSFFLFFLPLPTLEPDRSGILFCRGWNFKTVRVLTLRRGMLTPLTEEGLKLPLRLPRYRRGYIRTKESSSRKDRAESKGIWNFFNWRRRDFLNIRIFFFFFYVKEQSFPSSLFWLGHPLRYSPWHEQLNPPPSHRSMKIRSHARATLKSVTQMAATTARKFKGARLTILICVYPFNGILYYASIIKRRMFLFNCSNLSINVKRCQMCQFLIQKKNTYKRNRWDSTNNFPRRAKRM